MSYQTETNNPAQQPGKHPRKKSIVNTAATNSLCNSKGLFNFKKWEETTDTYLKQPLLRRVIFVALLAARHPKRTIAGIVILSISLVVAGFWTNFRIVADGQELWAPTGTRSVQHSDWIQLESGFDKIDPAFDNKGYLAFLVHQKGDNVLTVQGASCLFDAVDTIRQVEGYHPTCSESWGTEDQECPIISATALFDNDRSFVDDLVELADQDPSMANNIVKYAMSRSKYPNGAPVVRPVIFGYPEEMPQPQFGTDGDSDESILTSAASYLGFIPKSETDEYNFEADATVALYALQDEWEKQGTHCYVEANSFRALDDESQRGVAKDIPMMALAFCIMGIICALYLSNFKNPTRSQSILGVGAVVTVALSIMTSYGLLFCIGVPFTPVAQIFPYVMVGIGLDDTFIITGAYSRIMLTDPRKSAIQRLEACLDEVGISIVVSTLTTVVAFSLGCATSMPMIRWFCIYAAPTVMVDFIYQISFFVAIMVLDDARVQDNRYDCLVCVKSKQSALDITTQAISEDDSDETGTTTTSACVSNLMGRYCDMLLKPAIKATVLLSFGIFFGLGIYGATQQKQELDFREMMPHDSFIRTYFDALHDYSSEYSYGLTLLRGDIYFRNVDVSSPDVQKQMYQYVDDLVGMPYISSTPEFFWLRHFDQFKEVLETNYTDLAYLPFNDQLTLFLEVPIFNVLYSKDIVRDEHGNVTASRCQVIFDKGSNYDVQVQIETVREQRRISSQQPVNLGKDDWDFFMFTEHFFAWELHDLMRRELFLSLMLGLASVFVISLLFIPHPFGALALPVIVGGVYVQLMAFLYAVGIYINVVTAIGLVMSIGLIIDFNMHVALTYHETKDASSRDDRVRKVLTTMGSSIFVGGGTTMASALPLGLTGSLAFQTFFFTFLAIPILGVAHGLILLPVILSLFGPHDDSLQSETGDNALTLSNTDLRISTSTSSQEGEEKQEIEDLPILSHSIHDISEDEEEEIEV